MATANLSIALSTVAACSTPRCGAFWAGVLPNCTLVKLLDNAVVEYAQPLPDSVCSNGSTPHTAQDKGSPWFGGTGNGSFLYFTSGYDQISQIVTEKSGAPPVVTTKATLPKDGGRILGLRQVRTTPAPLFLVTDAALYAATAPRDGTMEPLLSLASLSLSESTRTAAAAPADSDVSLLYLLDAAAQQLHTVRVEADGRTAAVSSAALPSARPVLDLEPVVAPAGPTGELLALLGSPLQLALLDPRASPLAFAPVNLTEGLPALPFGEADVRFAQLGLPYHMSVAAAGKFYSVLLYQQDPPEADVHLQGPFDSLDPAALGAMGGVQYFV